RGLPVPGSADFGKGMLSHCAPQDELGAKVIRDERVLQAGPFRDASDAGRLKAPLRKFRQRGIQDQIACLNGTLLLPALELAVTGAARRGCGRCTGNCSVFIHAVTVESTEGWATDWEWLRTCPI